jgi:protein-disulfide isomerase
MRFARLALIAAGLSLASMPPAAADEFSAPQKTEIEGVIRSYLLRNPEVLREALLELQKKEKQEESALRAKTLKTESAAIFNSKHQVVVGNPNGKITMVEFFDYNCGYCRKALGDLTKLIKDFPELRVVLKEFPVLGPQSVEAAQVASAYARQASGDKYWDFHQKLFSLRGQIGKAQALAAARELGADMDRLEKDMKAPDAMAGVQETMGIADKLSLNGTPAWILGDEVVVGAVGYSELKGRLTNMQKCGKITCG